MISKVIWDLWCIGTVVGIWPRFIEPRLISTTHLKLPIKNLPKPFEGLKLIQFSDLHLSPETSTRFLKKIQRKIHAFSPDVILFTGDFICYSSLEEKERLHDFLKSLHAPLGCFAVYGNHDYSKFVSVNSEGRYEIIEKNPPAVVKGLKRLFSSKKLQKKSGSASLDIPTHGELDKLLQDTSFQLLHNRTIQISREGAALNISGVGEYMMGRCLPEEAFSSYDPGVPGIVLAHNPDCVPLLSNHPGDLILCGHTHGGQINLPGLRDKFIMIENRQFSRGLAKTGDKWVYTNRGIGGVMPFRWFCPPELLALTLETKRNA